MSFTAGSTASASARSRDRIALAVLLSLGFAAAAFSRAPTSVGVIVQDDAHVPMPWRPLSPAEKSTFDLGYAAFNTEWTPANSPAGRTDGLGPLFNLQSCDGCHNSRRRGRGPRSNGDAPGDLVMQLGRALADGSVERGTAEYGRVLNTSAVKGFTPEATVSIQYTEDVRTLPDGAQVSLRAPSYRIANLNGPPLPANTVIMPRIPPTVYGVGLLERVPKSALVALAASAKREKPSGRLSLVHESRLIGRFGWQATEPSVASQTASALAREMGLTSTLLASIDCGQADEACLNGPAGGKPEVESNLFDALVLFQEFHAVPVKHDVSQRSAGQQLFSEVGCSRCHVSTLPVETTPDANAVIHPYTDLLLHNLGEGLADRTLDGHAVQSEWRTAPLWGIGASVESGQPLRLLHDGRARSIEEAILWHDGAARVERERYTSLSAADRRVLSAWLEQL